VITDVLSWGLAALSLWSAWRVFRTDSMMRAAYLLLASFAAVGALLVLLSAEFLGLVLVLMMAGEMTIMVVFMVMFMMNPAGLNPMTMVHQHRAAVAAGIVSFAGLALVGVAGDFPDRPAADEVTTTSALGFELLGDSMLIFQSAGVTLLATMIGAVALTSRGGRFGDAHAGSDAPALAPEATASPAPATDAVEEGAHAAHEHDRHGAEGEAG